MADPVNSLELSDEEFLKMGGPPADDTGEGTTTTEENTTEENPVETNENSTDEKTSEENSEENTPEGEKKEDQTQETEANTDTSKTDKTGEEPVKSEKKDEEKETPKTPTAFEVPTSFKANGKTIELKDSKEAIQLMQMGANYARKMQELAPVRKIVMMLQNNDLLDESKLSYLIDLDRKDPAAIKKLIKDSEIDPLSIDTNEDPNYRPGGHTISDEEAGFRTVVQELGSDAAGRETLELVNPRLDVASREAIWKAPGILQALHEHRENGVYAKIVEEVDRRITLGSIPANTPFLQAYKTVGDDLVNQTLGTNGNGQSDAPAPKVVVDTRATAPKSPVGNGEKANAAGSSRNSPNVAKDKTNPLAMSDEAFLKQMENRL